MSDEPSAPPPPPSDEPEEIFFEAIGGFGYYRRKPFVTIRWGSFEIQVSTEEARRVAAILHEVSFSADMDAFLFDWVQQTVGADERGAAQIMADFRTWRAKQAEQDQTDA